MRQTAIIGVIAVLTVLAILGSSVISGSIVKQGLAGRAEVPVGAMQMMRDAKDLPVQQYDAH